MRSLFRPYEPLTLALALALAPILTLTHHVWGVRLGHTCWIHIQTPLMQLRLTTLTLTLIKLHWGNMFKRHACNDRRN